MRRNIYVAGFISRSIKGCGDMLGNNSEIEVNIDGAVQENSESFLDMINRGGLVKPSDIEYDVCTVAWDVYVRIIDSCEAKLYFLACNMQMTSHIPYNVRQSSCKVF